jgi:hypothetical protein
LPTGGGAALDKIWKNIENLEKKYLKKNWVKFCIDSPQKG